MQCLKCKAILPEGTAYCFNCGAPLVNEGSSTPISNIQAGSLPGIQASGWQEHAASAPGTSMPTLPVQPFQPAAAGGPFVPPAQSLGDGGAYMQTGWTEFSGVQPPISPVSGYPPVTPTPSYTAPGFYSPLPGAMPPVPPAPPKRRGPLATVVIILALLLVAGGVFAGIMIGQSHTKASQAQTTATPTASPTPDAARLYQQVTGKTPSFSDSLQNAAASTWSVYEKPLYGCEIKSDGLHVHIKDTGHYTYCLSGQGDLDNFAFQAEMKILSGAGGGMVFRDDTHNGDLYYFHVYANGAYHIYLIQNHQMKTELGKGTIPSFSAGFGQTNLLTVIAQQNQLYFYANRKLIDYIQDSTYTGGFLGFISEDFDTSADVVYTDSKIWIL